MTDRFSFFTLHSSFGFGYAPVCADARNACCPGVQVRRTSVKDRQFIRGLLVEILEADTGESFQDLQETDNLREGLGLDSVDVVSLVAQVERRFHVRLT